MADKKVVRKKSVKKKTSKTKSLAKSANEKGSELKKEEEKKEKDKLEEQIKNQNKILKGVLFVIGFVILIIVAWVIIAQSVRTFEYKHLEFEIVQEGDIIFYRTGLPTIYQGQLTEYSFYLRNDARKLENQVPFNAELDLRSNAVLNMESDFNCEGKGVIAIANLLKLYQFIGINVITDQNATCDPESKYTFIQILEGPETKIEETGSSCYNIYIHDCEILEGTERFMIETLDLVESTL
jgi:hypothetical protein